MPCLRSEQQPPRKAAFRCRPACLECCLRFPSFRAYHTGLDGVNSLSRVWTQPAHDAHKAHTRAGHNNHMGITVDSERRLCPKRVLVHECQTPALETLVLTPIFWDRRLLVPQGSIFSQRHRGHLGCMALCVGCLSTAGCGNTPGLHPLHSRSTAPTPLMTIKISADVPHVYLYCRRVHTGQSARGTERYKYSI